MTIRVKSVAGVSTTVHSVTVTPEYLQKLTGGRASAETLIEKVVRVSAGTREQHQYSAFV